MAKPTEKPTDKLTEQYRRQFYGEAREILDRLNEDVLKAEADPDDAELLNAVFRGIHTIKGSAGSFDLEEIAEFAHHFEGMLTAMRDGRIELVPDTVDVALAASDHIGRMVADCAAGNTPVVDRDLIRRFKELGGVAAEHVAEEAAGHLPDADTVILDLSELESILSEDTCRQLEEAAAIGLYLFRIRLEFSSELLENGYDPMVFLGNLRAACTAYVAVTDEGGIPALDDFSAMTLYLSPVIYAATALNEGEIRDLTFEPSLIRIEELRIKDAVMDGEPLRDFVDGAVEMLESLENAVIKYETSGSQDALNEIFRVVHSVKGDADLIGLREITVFAHSLESLLDRLRAGSIKRTFALVDVILQSVDYLRQSVEGLGQGVRLPEFPPILETLKQYAAVKDGMERKGRILGDVPAELADVFSVQAGQYNNLIATYAPLFPGDDAAAQVLKRAFTGMAIAARGVTLSSLAEQARKGNAALENGDRSALSECAERISAFVNSLTGDEEGEDVTTRVPPSPDDTGPAMHGAAESRTMRIDEEKVDHFTNLVGELLIARNTYGHLMETLETANMTSGSVASEAEPADLSGQRETIKALKENLHLFSRLTNDIHHGVMSLRMAPIRRIFGKFNRTVRDISRRQKKNIRLMTGGGEIEVDKKVADMLFDPLVHLVRNACDHGIESPDERRCAGKTEEGALVISASQEGSNLIINVVDDGRGIDRETLCEAGLRAGYENLSPDDPDLFDLLFQPGFSTSEKVSEISGRGVGLDAVKSAVSALSGSVRMTSGKEKGTEVVLTIPTTLGIDAVLFVDSGSSSYAIPLEYISETLKLPARRLKRAGHRLLFYHRGGVLPAGHLDEILESAGLGASKDGGIVTAEQMETETEDTLISVVILTTRLGPYGLIVDRMKKNMEVAMKPLPPLLAGIDLFGGVTIMGDGGVMLVINPDRLVQAVAADMGKETGI